MRGNLCAFAEAIHLTLSNKFPFILPGLSQRRSLLRRCLLIFLAPGSYNSLLSAAPKLYMYLFHSTLHIILYLFHIFNCLTANCEILQSRSHLSFYSPCLEQSKQHNNMCSTNIACISFSISSFLKHETSPVTVMRSHWQVPLEPLKLWRGEREQNYLAYIPMFSPFKMKRRDTQPLRCCFLPRRETNLYPKYVGRKK